MMTIFKQWRCMDSMKLARILMEALLPDFIFYYTIYFKNGL